MMAEFIVHFRVSNELRSCAVESFRLSDCYYKRFGGAEKVPVSQFVTKIDSTTIYRGLFGRF